MNDRRPSNKRIKKFCAEITPEDGTDPRDWLKGLHGPRLDKRKTKQLCAQVAETLSMLLAAEPDECLNSLDVVAVEPSPADKQLLVTLRVLTSDPGVAHVVLMALNTAAGRIRCEIASAITRKRVPLLLYRLVTIE
jgi:ribosome-binding factor A